MKILHFVWVRRSPKHKWHRHARYQLNIWHKSYCGKQDYGGKTAWAWDQEVTAELPLKEECCDYCPRDLPEKP